jgi:hypothetical protein
MSRNRKGSRTGRFDLRLCALQAGEARGAASPGPRQKSPAAAANPEDMSARRGGAARDGGTRFAKRICRGGACGCEATLHGNLFRPGANSPRCGRLSRPGPVHTAVIAPRLLRAKSQQCWGHVSCSQGVLWPNGAAAKGGAGRAIWGLEGPGSRASTERFAGKTPDRWQSTGAAATCQGAPLPCRGATAIPARNPGPADPNCRTVP